MCFFFYRYSSYSVRLILLYLHKMSVSLSEASVTGLTATALGCVHACMHAHTFIHGEISMALIHY